MVRVQLLLVTVVVTVVLAVTKGDSEEHHSGHHHQQLDLNLLEGLAEEDFFKTMGNGEE